MSYYSTIMFLLSLIIMLCCPTPAYSTPGVDSSQKERESVKNIAALFQGDNSIFHTTVKSPVAEIDHRSPFAIIRKGVLPSVQKTFTDPVFFQQKPMIGNLAYAHFMITIDLNKIQTQAQRTCGCTSEANLFNFATYRDGSHVKHNFELLTSDCSELTNFAKKQTSFLSDVVRTSHHRNKRAILLAVLGLSVLATSIISSYSAYMMMNLADHQTSIMLEIDQHNSILTELLERNEALRQAGILLRTEMNDYKQFTAYATQCTLHVKSQLRQIDRIQTGLHALVQGRISPFLINHETVNANLAILQKKIQPDEYQIAITAIVQFYQLPTSFIVLEKNIILAFVHVPLHQTNSILKLFKYQPIPQTIQNSSSHFMITTDKSFLAINDDLSFMKELSQEELNSCHSTSDYYYCDLNNVLIRPEFGTCTTALYKDDLKRIRKHCSIVASNTTSITQTTNNNFIVFLPEEHTVTLTCPADDVWKKTVKFGGLRQIHLPAGCSANSKFFKITAQGSLNYSASGADVYRPQYSIQELVGSTPEDTFHVDLLEGSDTSTSIQHISSRLLYFNKHPIWKHSSWTNTLLIALIIFITCVVGLFLILKRFTLFSIFLKHRKRFSSSPSSAETEVAMTRTDKTNTYNPEEQEPMVDHPELSTPAKTRRLLAMNKHLSNKLSEDEDHWPTKK